MTVVGAATEHKSGLGATRAADTGLQATIGTVVRAEETAGPITEVGAAKGPVTLSSQIETFSSLLFSVLNSIDQALAKPQHVAVIGVSLQLPE